jgi:uncharacterized protein (TIGR00304 family)
MIESVSILLIFLGIVLIFLGLVSGRHTYPDYRKGLDYEELIEEELIEEEVEYEEEKKRDRKIKGAGIIMIGPIPIIFGDTRYAFYLGIIAIILMILGLLFLFSI